MSEIENNITSHFMIDETKNNNAKVKVFGVGGAGGNTVNRMVQMNIEGVEYYAINTDYKALELSLADHKIGIGQKTTGSLGAGMKPEKGRKAAEESVDELRDAMQGADMIFITAGMGGGTGTGASPVVGAIARELGILTVAVVTKPFSFEGKRRSLLADEGIAELRSSVDTMIVVDNKKILNVVQNTDKKLTLDGSFKLADEILGNAVRSICDIMFRHGLIHVDFADIRTVMTNGGSALMGTGIAEGEGRGLKATDMALSSPLLEDVNVEGATGVLVNVSHGENFSMLEYSEAMEHIHEAVSDMNDPNIIIGDILLPELGDKVCITIIATGCGGSYGAKEQSTNYTKSAADLVNTLGAPVNFVSQPAERKPEAATPRPTSTNFAVLAKRPFEEVVSDNACTIPMAAIPQVDNSTQCFASRDFDATATSCEEEIIPQGTATATLPETEEMPAIAEVDPLSNEFIETPTYMRQTMSEQVVSAPIEESRNVTYSENSMKVKDVDYGVPAFLRMNGIGPDSY